MPDGVRIKGGGKILRTPTCVDRVAGAHIFGAMLRGGVVWYRSDYEARQQAPSMWPAVLNLFGKPEKGTLKHFCTWRYTNRGTNRNAKQLSE